MTLWSQGRDECKAAIRGTDDVYLISLCCGDTRVTSWEAEEDVLSKRPLNSGGVRGSPAVVFVSFARVQPSSSTPRISTGSKPADQTSKAKQGVVSPQTTCNGPEA